MRRLALALAVIPFWASYVVRSYGWSVVLARKGVLNDWLGGSGCRCSTSPIRARRW
ncbi:hypothetical protein [Rubrimonas cliftonensis]|uniref:hypothetical protein n=1 Tax=Rubrimonas cliftonensis TaxID=89524 RepID=UPI001C31E07C|nr:hypothetical protein [Rubrimonas cliftonensis]